MIYKKYVVHLPHCVYDRFLVLWERMDPIKIIIVHLFYRKNFTEINICL